MILSNVNIGTGPSIGDGDPLRSAFATINNNFQIVTNNVNALTNSVTSVAGRTGNVILTVNDIVGFNQTNYPNAAVINSWITANAASASTGNVKFLDTEIYTETGTMTFYNYGAGVGDFNRIDFETDRFTVDVAQDINLYAGTDLELVVNNAVNAKIFTFGNTGTLKFPDTTVQSTAWTGFTANAANWNGTAPTTLNEAIDRLAILVKTLNSGTGA